LLADDELVGVLSLYSAESNGFNEDHRRIIESVARQIAHTFKGATELEGISHDALTGLPNLDQLEQFVDATGLSQIVQRAQFTLLYIDIVGLKQINTMHGQSSGDEVLRHVVRYATAELRLADILFRYGSGEFIALLNDISSEPAKLVGSRIHESIRNNPLLLPTKRIIDVVVSVTAVSSPNDGDSLPALIEAARLRTTAAASHDGSTVH